MEAILPALCDVRGREPGFLIIVIKLRGMQGKVSGQSAFRLGKEPQPCPLLLRGRRGVLQGLRAVPSPGSASAVTFVK